MKTPGHEEYTILKRYKHSDRKAFKSKRRQLLDQKPTFAQKKWAVKQVSKHKMKIEIIAEFMGKSRSTIYRWIKEAREKGMEALKPKSKRPYNIKTISAETVKRILDTYEEHKCGPEKLAIILGDVSHMTVYRVLVRFGIISKGKLIRRRWRQFERKHPNSMWQIDIKTVSQYPPVYTVTILDDRSRFINGCYYYDNVPNTDDVIKLINKAIEIYGKTREILTDHGAQFSANREDGVSSFDMWLDRDVLMKRGLLSE